MDLRKYSERHDNVLEVFLRGFIEQSLPPHYTMTCDLSSRVYTFPHHITPMNLRPDIVWWNDEKRELWLFELKISYEPNTAEA